MTTADHSNAEELTVQALYDALAQLIANGSGNCRVAVPFSATSVGIGRKPAAAITGVHAGFDWNRGTVFLQPVVELAAGGDAMAAQARKLDKLSGRLFMAARCLDAAGSSPTAEHLAQLKKHLEVQ